MQIVRFSVAKKEMSAVLAGFITCYEVDSWRVQGHFFLGQTLLLMDVWQNRHPRWPVNHIFGKAVVTRMERKFNDFDKTRVWFEITEVITTL